MELTTEQQEHVSNAIVGLCMMILSTFIFHIYTTSQFRARAADEPDALLFIFVSTILAGVWIIGLSLWVMHFGAVSMIQRNNSLIGGIVVANIGMFWTRSRKVPEAMVLDYITNSFWSTYLGMVIGVLATYYFGGF
ncbi:hypothetical protein ZTR_01298 [Talaromyces verruculosus]|nr:hypothetical protein ZTR_01298 [Talaromyces verruculosus]